MARPLPGASAHSLALTPAVARPVSAAWARSSVAGLALAACGVLWSGGALAQSAASSASWPASSAPAMTSGDNGEIALDAITVAATYTPVSTINALAGVSTVRADELEMWMPDRTADVFRGMPGVAAIQNGNSQQTSINIRGLQDFGRVAVIVDGARQNFTQLGHANSAGSFFLEPGLLAAVDVVRGPVSNIYGSGAIGGVVTMRTKDANDILKPGETWAAQGTGEMGSNGPMGFGSAFGAARIGQNVDVFWGGTYRDQANYNDGDGNEVPGTNATTWTGIAKLTVRPADFHELKFSALNYDSSYTTSSASVLTTPTTSQYGTDVTNRSLTGSYNYSNPDDNLFDWRSTVYWNQVKQDQTKVAGTNSTVTGNVGNPRSFTIDTWGFDANNTSRFAVGGVRNAITIGGDYFHDDVNNIDNYGFGDGYNPSGTRGVGGAFAQWQANYSTWLEVIGAVRYDSYKLEGDGVSNSGDRVSPKITVGLTPVPWFTVYGTYAEGYRAPAVTETLVSGAHPPAIPLVRCPDGSFGVFCFVPNPELQPEVGKNKEIGVNLKFDDILSKGDKFRAKANVYRNDVSDFIELVQYGTPVFGSLPYAQYQNVSSARLEGFEFESMYDARTWFVGFNATVSDGKNTETDQPLSSILPDNVATTIGLRSPDQKLTLSARWQWVAAVTESDLPTNAVYEPTSSFNLVSLYLGYQPSENVLTSLSVENLLNEQYTQYQQFLPSAGLTVRGALTIRFGGGELAAAKTALVTK
ncbi:TonB-dependent hemoglobin/transferrin/lactoferrin family receptor [Azorhizobium oxalatiphilum]|uniref:TonB-dependent hemoglobin/transferrin/lactoferrin family receptor n=1 Tax=Azorhizobium oxalatiphilum TaxID=980631 RepID=UPI00166C756A|nr:TonB-dependent hemoglobin/transferrin/lactoferrin family receptor [Azorhizobium oxalatiphilum]